MSKRVRLLIADDSEIFVDSITDRLEVESDIEVVGVARDGVQAHEMAERLRPDVITMDIQMPCLDGFGAIERIMSSVPTPILVLTGDARSQDQRGSFEALSRGALELMAKPDFFELEGREGGQLCERVRLLAGISVVHHARPKRIVSTMAPPLPSHRASSPGLVVIGASTGGPNVLAQILGMLPRDFPLPIAVVQHLATGFVSHFSRWLSDSCELDVRAAGLGSRLRAGTVLVAPDDRNLLVRSDGRVNLTAEAPGTSYCPSVDLLLASAARHFGRRTIGVVLTGMGRDGAKGVAALHSVGAVTVAQTSGTCSVDGMPSAARATGKVTHVLDPNEIGLLLVSSAYELMRTSSPAQS